MSPTFTKIRKIFPGIGDGIASAPAGVDATGAAGAGAASTAGAAGAAGMQLVLQELLGHCADFFHFYLVLLTVYFDFEFT